MNSTVVQKRGVLWPILLSAVGVLNLAEYFYKGSGEAHDLLQGLGFVMGAIWLHFDPVSFSRQGSSQPKVNPIVRVAGMAGVLLLAVGLVVEWL